MPRLTLSLLRVPLSSDDTFVLPGCGVVLAHQGNIRSSDVVTEGNGVFASVGTELRGADQTSATALAFVLTPNAPEGALKAAQIDVDFPCLMRLDEVNFPPNAQAYRHVHVGPGLRHLRWGTLHLDADDHAFDVSPGDTWFEAAGSPVRATAGATETRFVRCMILPPSYAGKPTIEILDPDDATKARLQVTQRHVDQPLTFDQVEAG